MDPVPPAAAPVAPNPPPAPAPAAVGTYCLPPPALVCHGTCYTEPSDGSGDAQVNEWPAPARRRQVMRVYRPLPPILRVVSIGGILCALAQIPALIISYITSQSSAPPAYRDRVMLIFADLFLLCVASSSLVGAYSRRVGRPGLGPFPLDSWQSQMPAILLLSPLPLCAIVLALAIPPTTAAVLIVILIAVPATVFSMP